MTSNVDKVEHSWRTSVKKAPARFWFVSATVLFVLTVCIVGMVRGNPAADHDADAKRVCQDKFVPQKLQAPATARYSDVSVVTSGNTFTVTGSADAENSFGALLRMSFSCVVRESPSGTQWILVSSSVS